MPAKGISSFFTLFIQLVLLVFSMRFVNSLVTALAYLFLCQFMP